jgi:Werner syndrome ATP-dependent helicase
LEKKGVKACCYNSSLKDKVEARDAIIKGEYQIIYMTPETVILDSSRQLLTQLRTNHGLSLIAIDEAHCVSLWGNSFRDSYLRLSCLKEWFPTVPVLALTGTATAKVEKDMIKLLKLKNPVQIRTGCDRPNLSYYVHLKGNPLTDLKPHVQQGSSIIYCPTKAMTEEIAILLFQNGIACEAYHAGISPLFRDMTHKQFLSGELTCIVATVAFGMGIDKSDIRKVIHYGCPKDIESYTQEVGRAGRDGQPSQCHVYFKPADFNTNRYFLKDISDPQLRAYKEEVIHAIEQYMYSTTCRRQFILGYFGETVQRKNPICCDNCQSPATSSNRTANVGAEVQDFLNLVCQMGGKFGKLMYINTIRGANLKTMPAKFKASPYYGKGKHKTMDWWRVAVQHIINSDLITEKSLASGFGSVISLSDQGHEWLDLNKTHPTFLVTESAQNSVLFETKTVRAQSIVASTTSIPTGKSTKSSSGTVTKSPSQTQLTSYQMFHEGQKSINEIATERQVTTSTVEGHISECIKSKLPLDFSRLNLSKAKYAEIMGKIQSEPLNGDTSKLAPIKAQCNSSTTYFQIKCALAVREADLSANLN